MPKFFLPTIADQYKNDSKARKYFFEARRVGNPPHYKRVLFGRLADLSKEKPWEDILTKGIKSRYRGWLFHTAHHHEEWSITKDEAFYAGAIVANKVFQLITDIDDCINGEIIKFNHYMEANAAYFFINANACMKREGTVGVTLREILWMIDNQYTYRVSTKNLYETVFEPSLKRTGNVSIINYNPNLWTPEKWQQSVIDRLITIQKHIHEERRVLSQGTHEKLHWREISP